MENKSMGLVFHYYIGLGCNLGDRLKYFQQALQNIETLGELSGKSGLYESEPYGVCDQPGFLNAVVCLKTAIGPHGLLQRLKDIEYRLGRKKRYRWGPREIDLDILEYDGHAIAGSALNIPHNELEKRLFVLIPLKEIAADFTNRAGHAIDALIDVCGDAGKIKRLEQDW